MTDRRPPSSIRLRWCPTCGRNDRWTELKPGPRRHFSEGGKCPGSPIVVTYEPQAHARGVIDTVPGTAPLRAAIQVAATVTPALPYLSEPGDVSTHVGRVLLVSGDHPEQLAKMIEVHALGMVETLGNMVAAHPRPNPHDGWLR